MALLWHPTCSRLAVGGKSEEIKREKKDGMLKEEEKEKKKKLKRAVLPWCVDVREQRGGEGGVPEMEGKGTTGRRQTA